MEKRNEKKTTNVPKLLVEGVRILLRHRAAPLVDVRDEGWLNAAWIVRRRRRARFVKRVQLVATLLVTLDGAEINNNIIN